MSNKKKTNKKANKTYEASQSPSSVRRDRMKKAVVWTFVVLVIVGLVLSMSPDPTAFTNVQGASAEQLPY